MRTLSVAVTVGIFVACVALNCRPSPQTPEHSASQPASSLATTTESDSIPVTRFVNGRRIAEVITWHDESALTVYEQGKTTGPGKAAAGMGPYRQSFLEDSDHGSRITDAAWSPNGTYFAFKNESAGGHMPYRSPVKILKFDSRKLVDAENIIRRIRGISNVAVSTEQKPYIKWLSDTKLQVSVMSHDKPQDTGMYVIDMATETAKRNRIPD